MRDGFRCFPKLAPIPYGTHGICNVKDLGIKRIKILLKRIRFQKRLRFKIEPLLIGIMNGLLNKFKKYLPLADAQLI